MTLDRQVHKFRWQFTSSSRAMALIVVVYVIATLSILAFSLAFRGSLAIEGMKLLRERSHQDLIALSVCRHACRLLALDDPNIDSYEESWAPWQLYDMTDTSHQSMDVNMGDWQVYWRFSDESSKININLVPVDVLNNIDILDAAQVASILDWTDEDDHPNPDGAEEEYYQGLEPGYHCKNGPLDTLEGLLLIKGITPELYYERLLNKTSAYEIVLGQIPELEGQSHQSGTSLGDILTVYGDGKINLNTATQAVLDSIPLLSDAAVMQILLRQQSPGQSFHSHDDVTQDDSFTDMDKVILKQLGKYNSEFFRLQLQITYLHRNSSIYRAVVRREQGKTRVVSWQRQYYPLVRDPVTISALMEAPLSERTY